MDADVDFRKFGCNLDRSGCEIELRQSDTAVPWRGPRPSLQCFAEGIACNNEVNVEVRGSGPCNTYGISSRLVEGAATYSIQPFLLILLGILGLICLTTEALPEPRVRSRNKTWVGPASKRQIR